MAGVKQFSAKQKTAMTWWANPRYQEYDAIICDGAVRSGKTLSMGMGFFLWAMRRFSGEQFALCGKTIVSLRRNVLHEILPKVTALGFHCEEKRSENLVIVRSGGRENRFYLFGGYDEACSRPRGSSMAVASSRIRQSGRMATTPAMATRCFWPPDRLWGARSRYS